MFGIAVWRGRRWGTDMPKRSRFCHRWVAIQQHRDLAEWSGIQCHVQWWTRGSHWRSESTQAQEDQGLELNRTHSDVQLQEFSPGIRRLTATAHGLLSSSWAGTSSVAGSSFTGTLVLQEFPGYCD